MKLRVAVAYVSELELRAEVMPVEMFPCLDQAIGAGPPPEGHVVSFVIVCVSLLIEYE